MKKFIVTSLLATISLSASSQDFLVVPGAGTGTVSADCYSLTYAECDAFIDTTYNNFSTGSLSPPPFPLSLSNLREEGPYETNGNACFGYSYTRPSNNSSALEIRQIFSEDWSSIVIDETKQITLPRIAGDRCDPIAMPSQPGSYNANFCLSANGSTPCSSRQFTVVQAGGDNVANLSLNWYATLDQNWIGADVFAIGDTIRVLFGAQNNEPVQISFDADLKVYDAGGSYLTTKSGSINMPAFSNKDTNGEDPRFIASFDNPGTYLIQLCVGASNCKELKTITVFDPSSDAEPNISINWWNTFNSSWASDDTFVVGESIILLFGALNNEVYDATFDAELKVYDPMGNYVTTKTGSISMPANSNKDHNGEDPRFTTNLNNTGTYKLNLCVGGNCGNQKTITIQ